MRPHWAQTEVAQTPGDRLPMSGFGERPLSGPSHLQQSQGGLFPPKETPQRRGQNTCPQVGFSSAPGADARQALAGSETCVHPAAPRALPRPSHMSPARPPPANSPASPVTSRATPQSAAPRASPPRPRATHCLLGFALSLHLRDAPAAWLPPALGCQGCSPRQALSKCTALTAVC